jgi:hypothetical protein|tara:strand:+ start:1446 stop:1697 length:252 start_codon:yes stop_codon:yes gene_type:complete
MNIKAMMVAKATELAEQQADGLKETFLEYIKSDEFEKMIAEGMDKAINIPFVKDEKEAPIFRDVADLIQKLLAMIISGAKLGK